MTHEHINSTPGPRDLKTGHALERVTVGWTRAEELPAGELQTGDIRIVSEWLKSEARMPTPEMFDVRIKYENGVEVGRWTEPHTYDADERKQNDVELCRYCGLHEDRACHHGGEQWTDASESDASSLMKIDPQTPHVYEPTAGPDPDPDMDPCRYCGFAKHDSVATHVSSTARRDAALRLNVDLGAPGDPELRAARARNLGGDLLDPNRVLPVQKRASRSSGLSTSDPDQLTISDKKLYGDAVQVVHRSGAPTWSEPMQGFWVTLTRDDANHLVRKLRRAIQEAFGGDA